MAKRSRSESEDTVMAPTDVEPTPDYIGLCEEALHVLTLLTNAREVGNVMVWETRRYMAGDKNPYPVRDLMAKLKAALA